MKEQGGKRKRGVRPEVASASGAGWMYGGCPGLKLRDSFDGCHQGKEVPKCHSTAALFAEQEESSNIQSCIFTPKVNVVAVNAWAMVSWN